MNRDSKTILAIDTATEACSAALLYNGEIISDFTVAPREHSRLILKMVDQLLTDVSINVADLDAIAFGRGPGSFMGLRIAAGVVQGIAFSHDLPVIPVSTLKAIACQAYEETGSSVVLTAIDARMDEVYWCPYQLQDGRWQSMNEEQVISPDNVVLPAALTSSETDFVAAGTGWHAYSDRLLTAIGRQPQTVLGDCLPSAEAIVKLAADELALGNTVPAAEAIPVYLRNDVAKKPRPVVF
jgi:tRNA threonylcarbamoyladenosine biosynthesis protein TsaB